MTNEQFDQLMRGISLIAAQNQVLTEIALMPEGSEIPLCLADRQTPFDLAKKYEQYFLEGGVDWDDFDIPGSP